MARIGLRIIDVVARTLPRNPDLAAQFDLLADLMELEGADSFRVTAYRRAATRIRETGSSVAQLALDGRAKELQGIGKTIEQKIVEVIEDGEIHALTKRKAEVPADVARFISPRARRTDSRMCRRRCCRQACNRVGPTGALSLIAKKAFCTLKKTERSFVNIFHP